MHSTWRNLILLTSVTTAAVLGGCADTPTQAVAVTTGAPKTPLFSTTTGFWVCPSGEIDSLDCAWGEAEWCSDATSTSGAYCATGWTCFELAQRGHWSQCPPELPQVDPCISNPEMCSGGGSGGGGEDYSLGSGGYLTTTTVGCLSSTICASYADSTVDICATNYASLLRNCAESNTYTIPSAPDLLMLSGKNPKWIGCGAFLRAYNVAGTLNGDNVIYDVGMVRTGYFPQLDTLKKVGSYGGIIAVTKSWYRSVYAAKGQVNCSDGSFVFEGVQRTPW